MLDPQVPVAGDHPHGDRVQAPFTEDAEDLLLAAALGHQQHPLLALAEQHLVGVHAGFALRHAVEVHLDAGSGARSHLATGAGQPRRAHVLDAQDGAGGHGFEAGFEQQFFEERIAHLHVGALGGAAFRELLAGHGGAVDAVAAGLGADVDHRIADAARLAEKQSVLARDAQGEGVDQRVAAVAGVKHRLAAQVGDPEAVAVVGDAGDDTVADGPVLRAGQRAEAQRIHDGHRARAHGEDVAQDAAHPGRRALKRLNVAGVVVRFDLEHAGPAVAHPHHAGVLARPLQNVGTLGGQALEQPAAGFVGAVLAPHHPEHAQLGEVGFAAEQLAYARVLVFGQPMLPQCRGVHWHTAPASEAKTFSPSPEPSRARRARSGWGIRPTTLRPSLQIPAMSRSEPFGLSPA